MHRKEQILLLTEAYTLKVSTSNSMDYFFILWHLNPFLSHVLHEHLINIFLNEKHTILGILNWKLHGYLLIVDILHYVISFWSQYIFIIIIIKYRKFYYNINKQKFKILTILSNFIEVYENNKTRVEGLGQTFKKLLTIKS